MGAGALGPYGHGGGGAEDTAAAGPQGRGGVHRLDAGAGVEGNGAAATGRPRTASWASIITGHLAISSIYHAILCNLVVHHTAATPNSRKDGSRCGLAPLPGDSSSPSKRGTGGKFARSAGVESHGAN